MDGKKILQLSEATVDQVKENGYTVVSAPGQSYKVSVSEITNFENLTNAPEIGSAASLDVASSGDASTEQVVKGDDSRLTDARTPKSHTHGNISNDGKSTSEPTNTTKFLRADGTWQMPTTSHASVTDAVSPIGPVMQGDTAGYIKLATIKFATTDTMYVGINGTAFWRHNQGGTGNGRLIILPNEYNQDSWKGFVVVDAMRNPDKIPLQIKFGFVVDRVTRTLEIWCWKARSTTDFAYCNINAAAGSTVTCEQSLNVVSTEPSGVHWLSYLGTGSDMSLAGRTQYFQYVAGTYMQIKIPTAGTGIIDFSCSLVSAYWCYPFHVMVAGRLQNGNWNSSDKPSLAVLGSNNNSNGSYVPVMSYGADANNAYIFLKWNNTIRLFCTYSAIHNNDNQYNNMDITISLIGANSLPISNPTTGTKRYGNVHTLNYGTAVGSSSTPVYVDGEGCVRTASVNAMINSLSEGTSVPQDDDYIISQYVGGGTSNTTYYRRKLSLFWDWAKNKVQSLINSAVPTAVTNAINALDVNAVGGSGKYIKQISETNGKISATAANFYDDISKTYTSSYSVISTRASLAPMTIIVEWKPGNSGETSSYYNAGTIIRDAVDHIPELNRPSGSPMPQNISAIIINKGTKTATLQGFSDGSSWHDLPVNRFVHVVMSNGYIYREDN